MPDLMSEELDRRAKVAALDDYLRELDGELGPISSEQRAAAREWADRALGDRRKHSAGAGGHAA